MVNDILFDTEELVEQSWEECQENSDWAKDEFTSFVKRYESRYRTEVTEYVLAGIVGLWSGHTIGGKSCATVDQLFSSNDYDRVVVDLDDNGDMRISFYHHDGTHRMNFYLMTDGIKKRLGLDEDADTWDAGDFMKIYQKGKKVKPDTYFREAFSGKEGLV